MVADRGKRPMAEGGIRMTRDRDRLTDVEVDVIAETDKAWLVVSFFGRSWVPKSQAELSGDRKMLTLPERFAIEKGLV